MQSEGLERKSNTPLVKCGPGGTAATASLDQHLSEPLGSHSVTSAIKEIGKHKLVTDYLKLQIPLQSNAQ